MMKMSQWRCALPLQHPLIIKHQTPSKKKIKEAKTLSLCRDRSHRCQQGHTNLLDGQEGEEKQEEETM
jgi:hypothetical protein